MSRGLVGDLFAGGGGASQGIEAAIGRPVDFAINHDSTALAVHAANHPETRHLVTDIWEVDPKTATGGAPVDLLWASPDCTDFSVAKGGQPRRQNIRSLAWVVVKWARDVRPALILLENVAEFRGWGPLDANGKRIKERMGETFKRWKRKLESLGYAVDYQVLDASHYGAPTKRRRLFLVARCDGQPIRWPAPTHGAGLLPLRTAAECIDWSLPCPSIFERTRPLAEKTLWRIAQGIRRFVLESPAPFIVKVNHGKREFRGQSIDEPLSTVTAKQRGHALVSPVIAGCGGRAGDSHPTAGDAPLGTITAKNDRVLVAPTLIQTGYGERPGQRPRYLDLHQPLGTIMSGGSGGVGKHALVSAFLAKHFGDPRRKSGGGVVLGSELSEPIGAITARDHHSLAAVHLAKLRGECHSASVEEPLPTVTAGGQHVAEVRAFLTAYYGEDGTGGQALDEPLRTITAKARLGLVTVAGVVHQITDIGMRMLEPHELLRAQFGRFADGYDMTAAKTKAAKIRLIGNSVCPEVAEALVRANLPESVRRVA